MLEIPIEIFESDIFESVYNIEKSPCYLCARMRRGYLYSHAQKMGCNKIALGHHYDDVIETILMGMLYSAQVQVEVVRVKITLACTECKQRNYNMTKEKKNHPERMETKKYCKFCQNHTHCTRKQNSHVTVRLGYAENYEKSGYARK